MSIEGQKFYPGDEATPQMLLRLASEYRQAADVLRKNGRRRKPLSFSPYRLVVIQSVELYLDAYLRTQGLRPASLRKVPHNFKARAEMAEEAGLILSKGTVDHLKRMTETREYLVSRYDPDPQEKLSEITRLAATLHEVASQIEAALRR
ncbi:HEPN domain-containing protein [Sphingomonas alba]|uniref:HEPN domain-containing protein n=1 Tax=Sphingomonas alba TaxID=2908208 RepID=A0ABT0RNR2_9SPHN|nr:HEPN domain-containing protein [Sphingomonas alba]MCL6684291.1 HEPN domain-containing protein [Sphingomonas alba]